MYDKDPEEVIGKALPDSAPPARFDLDKIVNDGYRVRRRNRAVLGGAATAGVAALAGAMALVIGLSPGADGDGGPAPADSATPDEETSTPVVDDPSMAGYPYAEMDEFGNDTERDALHEGAVAAFGDLLVDSGLVTEEYMSPEMPSEEDIQALMEETGMTHDEAAAQLGPDEIPLEFSDHQTPGNYGQVWLRSYTSGVSAGNGEESDVVFRVRAFLPGGWTAEPGPITEQLFPQHIISPDDAYYGGEGAIELETTTLDDGRRLIVGEHECVYDVAVIYPNGSALQTSWDMGCGEPAPEYVVSVDDFTDAALAMPEIDYDTDDLRPVEELMDVPTGWLYDPAETWVNSDEAETGAVNTVQQAGDALQAIYPEANLDEPDARELGQMDRGSTVIRSYYASGELPFETTIDETTGPVSFDLRYYLPGGWVPGVSPEGTRGPYLNSCQEGFTCGEAWEDENGLTWTSEKLEILHEPEEGEGDWEPYTERQYYVTMYHPDGWAVGIWIQFQDEIGIGAAELEEILAAMPAPDYDEEATPEIPAR